jgi:hypothetical protein
MSGFQHLAVAVIAGGATFVALGARSGAPEPPDESLESPVLQELSDIRVAERSRRAKQPPHNRDVILPKWLPVKPAVRMPPTSCRSVEPVPKDTRKFDGAHWTHQGVVHWFEIQSGFGVQRLGPVTWTKGEIVAAPERDPQPRINRVELVSLLTYYEPSVYVLDERPTMQLALQAKRRPLDEFERLGLDALRRGEELVWTREAPKRMFGAIRAHGWCLGCHTGAKEGDLLGAFTYYLDTPAAPLNDN